jgi:hypothetical protein
MSPLGYTQVKDVPMSDLGSEDLINTMDDT